MLKKNTFFKLARIFLALVLVLCAVMLITSCGDDEEPVDSDKGSCANGHSWDKGALQATDDCSKGANKLFTCTACKATKTEKVDKLDHVFVETTIPSTCTKDGSFTRACKNCKVSTTTAIKAGHIITKVEVPATCTSTGSLTESCSRCDYEKSTLLTASHNYTKEVITATCTRDGAEVYTCSGCNDSYRTVTKRATGHNTVGCTWTKEDIQIEGCQYMHVETTKCADCNETVTHTSNFEKHELYVTITTTATCQVAGVKTKSCNNCSYSVDEPYTDVNAHSFDNGTVTANITKYACTNAGCTHSKEVYSAKNETVATVPSDALQSAGEVELQNASVKLDQAVLDQLGSDDVTISAETLEDELLDAILDKMSEDDKAKLGSGAIFNFTLSQNGDLVANFDGKITVTVPFTLEDGMDPDNIAIWYIDDNGNPASYPATYCEIDGQGYAIFETNHFSYYTVIRMSPAERCELYGHQYETTIVDAACNEQGYKMDTCKMCKDIKRYDFTEALTHSYTKTVVEATCKDKGYTTYECSNCKDKYVSDYVNTLEHTMETTVVAPTCNAKGYTLKKCSVCSYAYTESEVSATGHVYANGVCKSCGKEAASSGNTYLTLLNSIGNADSYLLKVGGFTISVSQTASSSVSMIYEIQTLIATVSINDKGYLEGKGEAKIYSKTNMNVETMEGTINATAVFTDGMIYVFASSPDQQFTDDGKNEMLLCCSQDYVLEEMEMSDIPVDSEELKSLWESMQGTKDNPLNAVLAKLIGYIFVQKETDSGYTYEFDAAFATLLYNDIKSKTVAELFDKAFGEGAFEETVAYIKSALGMTVAELEADGAAKLEKFGITLNDIYAIIESSTGVSISERINEMKDITLFEILSQMGKEEAPDSKPEYNDKEEGVGSGTDQIKPMNDTGDTEGNQEPTLEDLQAMIDEYAAMLKEMNALEGIFGGEIPEEDPYEKLIESIVAAFKNANLSFKTNLDGEFISAVASFNKFSFTYVQGTQEYTVNLNGTMSFSVNDTYMTDYSDIINEIGALKDSLTPEKAIHFDVFSIIATEQGTFIWSNYRDAHDSGLSLSYKTEFFNETNLGEEMYNGKMCTKYACTLAYIYKVDSAYLNGSKDCFGWYGVDTELNYNRIGVEATIWVNEIGKVEGLELLNVNEEYFDGYGSVEYYYAPSTGEYSMSTAHTYKHVQTIEPNGCEYGYNIYECTVCGHSYKESFGEGHKWLQRAVLKDGAKTCKDGVIITRYCSKCNQIGYEYETEYHETIRFEETIKGHNSCGDTIISYHSCACGQEAWFGEIISDHMFDTVSWEDDKKVVRCAINDCAYTYIVTDNSGYDYFPDREETCWWYSYEKYVFGDNDFVLNIDRTYPDHSQEHNRDNNHLVVTCGQCGITIYEEDYDSYGRTIYHYNYLNQYGWSREYTLCDYVMTYFDEDRVEYGTSHVLNSAHNGGSCTQYSEINMRCVVCGHVEETRYEEPNSWYYNYDTHDWFMNENGMYQCYNCGTESATGAEALISLEDMSDIGKFKVGYFNKREYDMDSEVYIELIINYTEGGDGILVENSESYFVKINTTPNFDKYNPRESGIVTVDLDALRYVLDNTEGAETISLVFWVLDESKTQVDPDTGKPLESWIAHALTFELSELYSN